MDDIVFEEDLRPRPIGSDISVVWDPSSVRGVLLKTVTEDLIAGLIIAVQRQGLEPWELLLIYVYGKHCDVFMLPSSFQPCSKGTVLEEDVNVFILIPDRSSSISIKEQHMITCQRASILSDEEPCAAEVLVRSKYSKDRSLQQMVQPLFYGPTEVEDEVAQVGIEAT